MFRTIAYWTGLILSGLFLLAITLILFGQFVDIWVHFNSARKFPWGELMPIFTLLLTALGTFSAVFFGWRLDRRQAKELDLKLKELELKYEKHPIKEEEKNN